MDDIQSWWEVPSIAHFCSLFRVAFNLLDFDIEELEEALLTDGTEDCGSSLLQELIVRLLCGILGNNGISTFNYQMFLRRLFRQKCREYGRENPFNTDIDFQFLPLRTKVEILHALCDFRLDADDVLDVLKNLDSDSLRVHPLGYDENRSAYWYFYGTRLYKEDYPKAKKKKKKPREREKQKVGRKRRGGGGKVTDESGGSDEGSGSEGEGEMGLGQWQVVCYTESDWERLAVQMEDSKCKEERALHTVLSEDFLPEIPRLFEEKERLQRKRLMEMQPRRQSSRIEKLKHQKEEEKQKQAKLEKLERQRLEREKLEKQDEKKDSATSRATRAMMRSRSSSECDSSSVGGGSMGGGSSTAVDSASGDRPKGRQTNNSLASATGQIIIHQQPSRQKLKTSQVFRQSDEDLRTGLYKILDRLKNHDDAWPFVDPVEEEYAPRYYSVIAKPMDLQRMEDKLDTGEYITFGQFKADFQLIIDNCRQYNGSDNEYTEMASKLQEAFEEAVERYLEVEVSSDEEVAVEFQGDQVKMGRKRKSSANTKSSEPPSPSQSLPPRSDEESDCDMRDLEMQENDALNDRGDPAERGKEESSDGEVSQTSEARSRKNGGGGKRRRAPWQKKSGVLKNVVAFDALELATEQTLKDISKWLDDTPRFSEFSSASNSPSQAMAVEDCDVAARIENDYRNRLKLDRPPRPRNYDRESQRRRLMKDQGFIKRRREIHRTIDRLQPGKSKGNLLSNLTASKNNEETSVTASKDLKTNITDVDESAPKLSLGTVLTSDVIGFGKHNFDENDSKFDQKENIDLLDDSNDDKRVVIPITEDDKKSQDIYIKSEDVLDPPEEKKVKTEEEVKEEKKPLVVKKKPVSTENASCGAKQAPNLSAWFKAFGAPKSQPNTKKKVEEVRTSVLEENKTSPKPDPKIVKEDELIEDDREKKTNAVVPPLQSPARRQRKASTGSSVSERSSFSQDPNDPMADGSSPRPSLDEPYLSPQSEPMKTPYHHSPVNGTIRVGFYQDTSFPRSNSSSSPRDPPSCSPRDPPSCSPRDQPDCSPRELPNFSPKEPAPSPKTTDYRSPFTPSTLPNYSAPVVTTSSSACDTPLYEAPMSPFPAHMPYYDTSKPIIEQYRSTVQTPVAVAPVQQELPPKPQRQPTPPPVQAQVEKCMFPVKKRGYSDVESIQQPKPIEETPATITDTYRGGSFAPTRGAVEQDRAFTPTPGRMPTSHAPTPVHHAYPPESSLPLGLSHHALPPPRHPLDRFTDDRLLQAPFFSTDYSKTIGSADQLMYPQTHAPTTPTTSYPGKEACHQYPGRPDLGEVNVSTNYNRPGPPTLSYSDPRAMKQPNETVTPSYHTGRTSPSVTALNYSRTSDIRSPSAINPSSSPLNFSNTDKRTDKIMTSSSSSPVTYMTRPQDLKRMPPTSQPLAYGKVVTTDLSVKANVSSPLSYTSRQPMTDMISRKVPSPFCGRPDLSDYTTAPDLVANKLSVPSPLSYATTQQDLMKQVNYSHPMSELMQSQARYNYPISELMQGKGYQAQLSELMQGKSDVYGNRPGEHLLSSQVYNYPTAPAPAPTGRGVKETAAKSAAPPKKQSKKKKAAATAAATVSSGMEASGFQQYSSAASDAIALKSAASVVPGSAFNFGPAPHSHSLKDSYASYMDDIRSSGYYVPPQQPPDPTTKANTSHPTFSFLGNSPAARPPYPPPPHPHHPFMNSPYQQYLQRHPEDILRPMVLHQGLLPSPSYPPGYLGIHDPIPRPSWL